MSNLDALQQRAADNKVARFAIFLDALEISAQAADLGPGAKATVGEYMGYSTRTVTQLAEMYGLPEELIDLDAKPGMYWAVIQNAPAPVETIRLALQEGWTTAAQVKEHLGITNGRKPPLLVSEVDVVEVELGQMIIQSAKIKPEDGYPSRAPCLIAQGALENRK